jgi:hypothetical protein
MGVILSIAIGVAAILLGAKGFSAGGLPVTGSKRMTGPGAKVTGLVCILIGLLFIAATAIPIIRGLSEPARTGP